MPRKFRKELNNDVLYVVKGLDGELWGFNSENWAKEAEIRLKIPLTESRGRVLRRRFFSQAEECNLDKQGRFIISQELVDYTGLKNEVLLIGAGDHLEIWEEGKFESVMRKGLEA